MLNELHDLSLSLERAGIVPTEWHPDLKELPKVSKAKPCFKIYLAMDGSVTDIEPIEDDAKLDGLRKWQSGGNGFSFPCFNVRPLFKACKEYPAKEEEKNFFDAWLKEVKKSPALNNASGLALERFTEPANTLWSDEHNKRVAECLGLIPEKLREIAGKPPDELRAIAALFERCQKVTVDNFLKQVEALLIENIRKNPAAIDKYIGFLLHCGKQVPANDIQLVLELADGLAAFPMPVAMPQIHSWLNQQLLTNQNRREATTENAENLDAFGAANDMWEDKLPEVSVPVLGGVKLRAMNPESPCQTRYRRTDAASFVVGKEIRKRAKGALEWLTDDERKNKTWGSVTSARDDKEILLVYPSELPKVSVAAVAMFGGSITNSETGSARFAECAKNVTDALRSIPRPLREVEMRVFALRKMDKARTQVSCNRNYSAERLIAAAEEWQTGCSNVPTIRIKQWGKEKGAKPEWNALEAPFPLEVVWCLNTVWNKAADTPTRVREFSSSDGVGLLLDEGVRIETLIERALHAVIRNGGNLLVAIAQAHHLGEVHKIGGKYEKQKLLLPAMLGLFLAKLGKKKEEYMKSAPYLIGRMLSLADQIHYHYCQHVRNGQAPTQLIGNALMATALEEPEKALALYAQRILPYQAWARTFKGGEDDQKRIRGTLKQLGETCSEVSLENVPDQCADTDKAQMLLGYLARFEKSE